MFFRNVIISLLLVPLIVACGGAGAAPAADTSPDANADPQQQPPQQQPSPAPTLPAVVATVNGQPISAETYQQALQRRQAEVDAADPDALATSVLNELINQLLIEQAAERMGITVTDADLDAEIAELKAIIDNDEDAWQTWLDENDYTETRLREELRAQLITAQVRDQVVGEGINEDTAQVQARHILVDTREQAATIRAQLAAGEDFVELAARYSKDVTTRDQGGDLGWFTEEGLLEPVVAEVAFSQPAGAISEPVPTRLGWHIIETLAFDNLPLPPEKQAQAAQVVFDEWLATQADSAMIEMNR